MEKRKILFGTYDTAVHGWTLTGWTLARAEQKTKYLDKPNGDGAWDLSTATTGGVMRYKNRNLKATFECSEGTRLEREEVIRHMINTLDGMKEEIRLPDDPHRYVVGRLQVKREYNDLAHAAVTVEAVCEPWKYANFETVVVTSATTAPTPVTLYNGGRRTVVPVLTVTGGDVLLEYGDDFGDRDERVEQGLSEGTHQWPDLVLKPGQLTLLVSGTGTVIFTYREAVLE